MNTIVITPPVTQLNTPYPSGAYLKAYFKSQDQDCTWYELNIHFFNAIFSHEGLTKLFELSEKKALETASSAEKRGDTQTVFNIRRYISTKNLWITWIDFITATLRGEQNRERQHQFLFSPFVPRGNRMENYLAGLETEPGVEDVRFLCSLALADLADYINVCFDSGFSLISYAESVCTDEPDFAKLEKSICSPILENFYRPVLENFFGGCGSSVAAGLSKVPADASSLLGSELPVVAASVPFQSLTRFCISIPFAGTFIPALYTAKYLKEKFGSKAYICLGGGYVNTCMRNFKAAAFYKYADALSFDRGYGSYWEMDKNMRGETEGGTESGMATEPVVAPLSQVGDGPSVADLPQSGDGPLGGKIPFPPLYKLRQFTATKVIEPVWTLPQIQKFEDEITAQIVPDYSDINFALYPRLCDDKNPMHRLWTDGAWIKAYLAHGCYWHKCAFCDTKLDYVCGFKTVNVEKLYYGLLKTAQEKQVYGIHFVDEAIPPAAVKKFALLNAQNKNPLYYWGNVRFEKPYTKDFAALLSYCGLGAVSAGIEVATGKGLKNINKGTDLNTIVSACAAFKEAGILVHSYMIYGFWYDNPQTIIDSMETLRQFFASGLLDSAFWHKFELTPNSEAYDKLKTTWKGGKEFEKFGRGLNNALDAWMHGQSLEEKVQSWFDFQVPQPSVSKRTVENAIEEYECQNEARVQNCKELKNVYWLGGNIVCLQNRAVWNYLMEENSVTAGEIGVRENELKEICSLVSTLRPEEEAEVREEAITKLESKINVPKFVAALWGKGFCILD